jgi:hypothetical protein
MACSRAAAPVSELATVLHPHRDILMAIAPQTTVEEETTARSPLLR